MHASDIPSHPPSPARHDSPDLTLHPRWWGLPLSVVILGASSAAYAWRNSLPPELWGWLTIPVLLAVGATCLAYRWPAMYLLRVCLLASPGVVATLPILFVPYVNRISPHAIIFQTPDAASRILLLTFMALGASGAGWGIAVMWAKKSPQNPGTLRPFGPRFVFYFLFALFWGTIDGIVRGPMIWSAVYASSRTDFLQLGSTGLLATIGVLGMAAFSWLDPRATPFHRWLTWATAIYVGLFCMFLHGARMDPLGLITALYFTKRLCDRQALNPVRLFIAALLVLALALAWGQYRFSASAGSSLADVLSDPMELVIREADDGGVILLTATMGEIAITFYNIIGLFDAGVIHTAKGSTYAEFIPRTPPKILYKNRPIQMAWFFQTYGETAGGGFFELSEAYYNFGPAGMALIPALVTWLLAQAHIRAVRRRTPLSFLMLGILLALCYRGTWYQNFVFYKGMVIWITIEIALLVFTQFKRPRSGYLPAGGVSERP